MLPRVSLIHRPGDWSTCRLAATFYRLRSSPRARDDTGEVGSDSMSSNGEIDLHVEEAAQQLAAAYRKMRYGLGSIERHSIEEIVALQAKAEARFEEPHRTKLRERFHALVGLDGDRGRAWDKLYRDFPK